MPVLGEKIIAFDVKNLKKIIMSIHSTALCKETAY
jgi:hypothetical protein